MIPYTTPTIPLEVAADLAGCEVYATISQGENIEVTKQISDFTVENGITTINFPLTQAESGSFLPNSKAEIQVNWINSGGDRDGTDIETVKVFKNLLDEVITYGD